MRERGPTACVKSTGCISNLLDGTRYEELLKRAGYRLVKDIKDADLVILNTCAFSRPKEEESVKLIEQSKIDKRDGAQICVCGCLPTINSERLKRIHHGVAFGPADESNLRNVLPSLEDDRFDVAVSISYSQYSPLKKAIYQSKRFIERIPWLERVPVLDRLLSPLFIYSKDVFCLKVETGCEGSCTYCAIRFAKGRTRSRSLDEIKAEFDAAISRGFSKFVLVGDEITSYGCDMSSGVNILDVIRALLKDHRLTTLFLESFEPSFMISNLDEILRAMSSRKIPVFCSSVQSGSNRVLKMMNRPYRVEDFISCMKAIRRNYPHVYLRTEIIVGFPGETEDEFRESLDLVASVNFDFVHVYEYDDRPNTPASRMPHKVPQRDKRVRKKRILRQHWRNLLLRRR